MSNVDSVVSGSEAPVDAAESATVGALITRAREAAGLTREELAVRMCMTPGKLEHLERDDFERLAGATYVRGYLRNTCKELGIDAAPLLEALERQLPAQVESEPPSAIPRGPVIARGGNASGGGLFRPLLLVAIVAAAGGYWWFNPQSLSLPNPQLAERGQAAVEIVAGEAGDAVDNAADDSALPAVNESAEQDIPDDFTADDVADVAAGVADDGLESDLQLAAASAPETGVDGTSAEAEVLASLEEVAPASDVVEAVVETVQQEVAAAAAEPAPEPVAAAPEPETVAEPVVAVAERAADLSLTFTEESWVEVTDASGTKLLAKLQPAGSSVVLEGEAPFQLMLGNATGTVVSYRGEVVDSAPLGNRRTRRLTVGG